MPVVVVRVVRYMSISVAYTRNVTAFGTVALPQVCLHLISLAMLELKYRSPPGTFQFECAVHALVFFPLLLVQTYKCRIEEVEPDI
jgi:hypothetical protein